MKKTIKTMIIGFALTGCALESGVTMNYFLQTRTFMDI